MNLEVIEIKKYKNTESSVRDCTSCLKCLHACQTHSWFFTICCGYVVLMSLPQTLCVLDFAVTLIVFCTNTEGTLDQKFKEDMEHFNFSKSSVDLLFISFFRSIILFVSLRHKYQVKGTKSVYISIALALFTTIYGILKLVFHTHHYPRDLAIFALILCWFQLGIFILVRRRKITMARDMTSRKKLPYMEVSQDAKRTATFDADILVVDDMNGDATIEMTAESIEPPSIAEKNDLTSMEFSNLQEQLRLPDSTFTNMDGVNIHYCKQIGGGGKQAPWLVLMHGTLMGGIFSWRQSIPRLLPHVAGIIAFDRPGFGLTDRPQENSTIKKNKSFYSVYFAKRIIKHLMDLEGIPQAVFIGHSTGATLSCWFAQDYPDMVQGLVLLAPSNGLPSFIKSLLKTNLARKFILQLVKTKIGQVTLQKCWHKPKLVPAEVKLPYKMVLALPDWGEGLWAMSRNPQPTGFSKCLKGIDAPVLMLHGEGDKLVGYAESARVQKKFPEPATLKKIKACGHLSMEEKPAEVCEEILLWLNDRVVELKTFDDDEYSERLTGRKQSIEIVRKHSDPI